VMSSHDGHEKPGIGNANPGLILVAGIGFEPMTFRL
jgi:hypothetical protein